MASVLASKRSEPDGRAVPARAAAKNNPPTHCLALALIFRASTRFFCPLEQEIDAAVHLGPAVRFEVQFGHPAQVQPGGQFVPEIMAGVVERRERGPLLRLATPQRP